MGKLLGLDYGTVRIGVAISDPAHTIAFPRTTLLRLPEEDFFRAIEKLIKEEGVERVVLGLPVDENNEPTILGREVEEFAEKLREHLKLPVEFIDEFNTSRLALAKIPFRKDRRRKGTKDEIAAQIILQRYLDL